MIDTILFDLDGTLINTPLMIMDAFKNTIKRHKGEVKLEESEITNVLGQTLDSAFKNYVNNDEELKEMINSYRYFTQNNTFELKVYNNLENVIKYLRDNNYKVGIVTSKTGHVARKNLEDLNIEHLFDVVIVHEDTKKHKPNPDPLLKAIKDLNKDIKNVIYIGDHENDIKAGNNANVKTGLMGYSYRRKEALLHEPTYVFENLDDITKVF